MSQITGLAPSVLRFWEEKFPQLKPLRMGKQRLYSPQDVELIMEIKRLVKEKNLTLEGARKELEAASRRKTRFLELILGLEGIKEDLKEIQKILKGEA